MNCLKYLTSVRKTSNNLSDVHFHELLHRKYPVRLFIYLVCVSHIMITFNYINILSFYEKMRIKLLE